MISRRLRFILSSLIIIVSNQANAQTKFAIIGDYGNGSPAEADVSAMINTWNVDFIITNGDNNYDVGSKATIDEHIGQFYSDWIGDYTGIYGTGSTSNKFFPSLGNHDWGTLSAIPYLDYFTLPGVGFTNSSGNERYYDFVWDNIHFFAVDSDGGEPDGNTDSSVQSNWLESELTSCVQNHSHWRIVYFHHAPYSSEKQVLDLRWDFEDWGAHTVLSGHAHTYERVKVGNIRYFVNGLGGKGPRTFGKIIDGSEARCDGDNGAQLVTVNETEMTLEFWSIGTQFNNEPQLIDSYTFSYNLISHLKMDEGNGTTLVDASTFGNSADIIGNPKWVYGVFGQALKLDGIIDYAVIPDDATVDLSNAVTLAAWIKPEVGGTQNIIKKVDGLSGYELFLSSNSPDIVSVQLNGSTDYKISSTTTFPTDGTWMHVAATFDGTVTKLYINGVQEGGTLQGPNSILSNNVGLGLGSDHNGNDKFIGTLDDVRVYNRALDATEIIGLATAPPAPLSPNLSLPANGSTGNFTTATLNWNLSTGATSYRVQVSTTSDFSNLIYDQSISTTSTQIAGLLFNTQYYWRVNDPNIFGTSLWSPIWNFTTISEILDVRVIR